MRAPLRAIDGFSQVVLEDYGDKLDDGAKNYLGRIRKASQRMGELIDDLLKLSHINRVEMHTEAVDLSELVRSIINTLHQSQPERRIEMIIQDRIVKQGDRGLLTIALENLLGNAWKFTARRSLGRIEFGTAEHDGVSICYVRDNGVGFDMKYEKKLFSPFQRLHSEKDFSGTGIGLSTVERIIRRHGGRIWAEGAVDQGATFYFTFP
ncbi:MAG: ATP-binding protein [Anaerolineaceae bacterium]